MTISRQVAEIRVAGRILADRDHAIVRVYDDVDADAYGTARQIAATPKTQTVAVMVDSPGGSLDAARAVVRAIEARGGPSVAVGVQQVASAAALIFAACGRRYAHPETRFFLHPAGFERFAPTGRQTAADLKRQADRLAEADGWIVNRLVRATGRPAAEIERLMAEETEMGAHRAKAIGLVSSIIQREPRQVQAEPSRPVIRFPCLPRGLMQYDPRMMGFPMTGRPIGMAPAAFEALMARHWSTMRAGR